MRLLINILISFKHFHFLLLIFSSLSICSSTSTSSSSSFFLISLISLFFSFILFVSSLFRFPGGNRVYIIFWLTFEAKSKYLRDGTNYSQLLTPFFPENLLLRRFIYDSTFAFHWAKCDLFCIQFHSRARVCLYARLLVSWFTDWSVSQHNFDIFCAFYRWISPHCHNQSTKK